MIKHDVKLLKKSPQYWEHKGGFGGRFEQVMDSTLQFPHIEERLFPVVEGVLMDRAPSQLHWRPQWLSAPPPSPWRAGQGRVFCRRHFFGPGSGTSCVFGAAMLDVVLHLCDSSRSMSQSTIVQAVPFICLIVCWLRDVWVSFRIIT